ncbi:MAG: ComEC/Rec2 family competence protein [SAR324 cluster bacterium]|nr:ComEC/Rec2 family competence protein [SAR324 cluster bacterium]
MQLIWLVPCGLLALLWSVRFRVYLIAMLLASGIICLMYQFFFQIPEWHQYLIEQTQQQIPVIFRGTILTADKEKNELRLHLKNVLVVSQDQSASFQEMLLRFPYRGQKKRFYYKKHFQFSGVPTSVLVSRHRLDVVLKSAQFHEVTQPTSILSQKLSSLRARLINRAQFYLSPEAASIYLPLTLAHRSYFPETRQVFNETGMAHILAISGLHIGLIYGLCLFMVIQIGKRIKSLLSTIHLLQGCHFVSLGLIWGYVGFLGFPVPALRAAVMITFWVCVRWFAGYHHRSLDILLVTAMIFLVASPTAMYDISFQLSFTAVLYIIMFSPLSKMVSFSARPLNNILRYCWSSFWVTGVVSLGLWPVTAWYFQYVSLESFWMNLVMIPVLGVFVLPVCLITLGVSTLHLDTIPNHWLEQTMFQITEFTLNLWFSVMKWMHFHGSWAGGEVKLEWESTEFLWYYGLTVFAGFFIQWIVPRRFLNISKSSAYSSQR